MPTPAKMRAERFASRRATPPHGSRGPELREHIEALQETLRPPIVNFEHGWAILFARKRELYPIARSAHWYQSDGDAYRSLCAKHIVAVTDAIPRQLAPDEHRCQRCLGSIRAAQRQIRQAQMRLQGIGHS